MLVPPLIILIQGRKPRGELLRGLLLLLGEKTDRKIGDLSDFILLIDKWVGENTFHLLKRDFRPG